MKNKPILLMVFCYSFSIVGCPFKFTNDLSVSVFIADDLGKGILLAPQATKEINPAKSGFWKYLAKERLYIYYETEEKNKFLLKYRLIDDYCTDDSTKNSLKVSEIDQKIDKIAHRFRIKLYNKE